MIIQQTIVLQHVLNHKVISETLTHKYENVSKPAHKAHSLTQTTTDNADHIVYLHYLAKTSPIHVNQVVKQVMLMKEHDNA